MDAAIWTAIAAGLISWGCVAMGKKGVSRFWRVLVEANERHGTRFGTSPDNIATVVGGNLYKGGALASDQIIRKIAYITKGGKSIEILDCDFVQSWRVTWRERTSGSGVQFGMVALESARTSDKKTC
jgi:hypothetical protein